MSTLYLVAILLGIVEGSTEFIPVSSTGHLILLVDLIGFQGPPGKVFEIAIQLGAILAVCWSYREKLWTIAVSLPSTPSARRFLLNLIIGFLPAAIAGVLFYKVIKGYLFSPWVVAIALIIGGIIILFVERNLPKATVEHVDDISPLLAVKIGCAQILAMIPGVSRSGATIIGALLMGTSRKAATEFSFFLAIPTMFGATFYDLYKNAHALAEGDYITIGIGFIAAFMSALLVVRTLINFVSRHGFRPFAWYRIIIGVGMLVILTAR